MKKKPPAEAKPENLAFDFFGDDSTTKPETASKARTSLAAQVGPEVVDATRDDDRARPPTPEPEPEEFDFREALAEGHAGADAALEAQDLDDDGVWSAKAHRIGAEYCRAGVPWSSNDIRKEAGPPPRPKAFGGVMKALRREFNLEAVGQVPALSASARGRWVTLWQAPSQ